MWKEVCVCDTWIAFIIASLLSRYFVCGWFRWKERDSVCKTTRVSLWLLFDQFTARILCDSQTCRFIKIYLRCAHFFSNILNLKKSDKIWNLWKYLQFFHEFVIKLIENKNNFKCKFEKNQRHFVIDHSILTRYHTCAKLFFVWF